MIQPPNLMPLRPVKGLFWAIFLGFFIFGTSPVKAEEDSVFRRFIGQNPAHAEIWGLEFPLSLRPQTQSDAVIITNQGINYFSGTRPDDRLSLSRRLGFAKAVWEPLSPEITQVKVVTLDIAQVLNYRPVPMLVFHLGLGVGLMDGLVILDTPTNYQARLEPFIPMEAGFSLRPFRGFQLGLKVAQSTFFRSRPVVSMTRMLLSFAFSY